MIDFVFNSRFVIGFICGSVLSVPVLYTMAMLWTWENWHNP